MNDVRPYGCEPYAPAERQVFCPRTAVPDLEIVFDLIPMLLLCVPIFCATGRESCTPPGAKRTSVSIGSGAKYAIGARCARFHRQRDG